MAVKPDEDEDTPNAPADLFVFILPPATRDTLQRKKKLNSIIKGTK